MRIVTTAVVAIASLVCAHASAEETTFADDFEDAATTEAWWQQTTSGTDLNPPVNLDSHWNVIDDGTGNGILEGNGAAAPIQYPYIAANRLGCSSLDGFSLYRNTVQTVSVDMRLVSPNNEWRQGGIYILGDMTHPTIFPVAGLSITYQPGDGAYFVIFQDDDFEGSLTNLRTVELFFAPGEFDPLQMHRYTIQLENNTITASVSDLSGELIAENSMVLSPTVVSPFQNVQQGNTGLWLYAEHVAQFDNFSVTGEEICLDNTDAGTDVEVELIQGITATFDEVAEPGTTTVVRHDEPPLGAPTSTAFEFVGEYFDVTTTATFAGDVSLCFPYVDTGMTLADEENLRLLHFDEALGVWEDVTLLPNDTTNNIICGATDSFSFFAIGLPELVATVGRPLGNDTSSSAPAGPYKRGRTVPVKFQLRNSDGTLVSDAQALALDVRLAVYYDQAGAGGTPVDPGDNPPDLGDSFRYDAEADQFIFNLGTRSSGWLADYSYRVVILVSGTPIAEAYFSLR